MRINFSLTAQHMEVTGNTAPRASRQLTLYQLYSDFEYHWFALEIAYFKSGQSDRSNEVKVGVF